MIRLPTAALTALRNRLAEAGARPSMGPPGGGDEVLESAILEEYGPLCDAMYLMMAADGELTGAERDVIRGALRELDDRIRSRHVEALMAGSADALERQGREGCYVALGEALRDDPARAEAAVLLAAAVAYADGEIAGAEDEVMADLMRVLTIDAMRMRVLMGSLERMDTMLERDAKADAADVVIHAALRLHTPEDFERLVAKSDRPDVTITLRLFGAYVHATDDLLDRETHPRSLSTACVAALGKLAQGLLEVRSPRLDDLRGAFVDLVTALERIDRATALCHVTDDQRGPSSLGALDEAMTRLSELASRALERVGVASGGTRESADLRGAAEGVLADRPGARVALAVATEKTLSGSARTVPSSVLATIGHVLARLKELPLEGPPEPSSPPQLQNQSQKALPEWLPRSRTLGGWYVVEPLGVGGTASVFVAVRADERDDSSAERFALKVPTYDAVAARSVSESEYLSVFKREAGALLALPDHPNIAGFVTFDARARPKPLLVMELIEGVDCQALIKQRALEMGKVLDVLDGILAGLCAMHAAGLGHLDVKPSNVVLRKEGAAVLVDLGLAGRRVRVGCATPTYASPEVWGMSDDDATPFSADVYSFGCTAYELLTGKVLFAGTHPLVVFGLHCAHDGDPPPVKAMLEDPPLAALGAFLSKCLRRHAKDRAPAPELREALSALRPAIAKLTWPC